MQTLISFGIVSFQKVYVISVLINRINRKYVICKFSLSSL